MTASRVLCEIRKERNEAMADAKVSSSDIDQVVRTTADAGLSRPVAKLVPVGNVKG